MRIQTLGNLTLDAIEGTAANKQYISGQAPKGCAKKIVAMCKDAGVTLTGAGATYPYKKDPDDSNIRIAPTFPPIEELSQALDIFTLCVKLASVEKMLEG